MPFEKNQLIQLEKHASISPPLTPSALQVLNKSTSELNKS